MDDDAEAHFCLAAREHLNSIFCNRWVDGGRLQAYPRSSTGLKILKFFLWAINQHTIERSRRPEE